MEDEQGPTAGMGDIIIAKHRNGSTDTVRLRFIGKYAKFDNVESFDGGIDDGHEPAPLNPNREFESGGEENVMIRSSKMDDFNDDDFDVSSNDVEDTPF